MPLPAPPLKRCPWPGSDSEYIRYHDQEWGVPVHDDRLLFEFLILEGMQAGLSWITILKKRECFRKVFDGFRAEVVARYQNEKINHLLKEPGIVRNRLKIEAAVANAKAYLAVRKEYGSFNRYIWQFTEHKTKTHSYKSMKDIPAQTAESDRMSRELKKKGFKFVGPTICYAFMQAVGMVNDHLVTCFRYNQIQKE
ncbi:MAG TPA: DNA-3-methyladenine glycosylase I [Candidatus Omnitrophota bacterium]|jgi:DNA-3-methyladenine glycosylase I|nr:DNA-3-methyladenine glycosylase I [Candidatus Omnitrophota bacterium]HPN55618.1 DNA-3-methyladenine glycosylase I [Candidatus Omnitrophota bacterium]